MAGRGTLQQAKEGEGVKGTREESQLGTREGGVEEAKGGRGATGNRWTMAAEDDNR